ncbi:MAG: hypothetical protein LBK82_11765 [Planctomycetaceae bacterium]|nr:hypothetical protein [Planctomycetaceae bacterium]
MVQRSGTTESASPQIRTALARLIYKSFSVIFIFHERLQDAYLMVATFNEN